ncbi:MAG: glycosyltransferase family 4 protein [Candidatus Atribacteria bacterium]
MNVLILTDSFPPEIKSSANLLFELSEDLAESGHRVTVVTGFPKHYVNNIDQRYKGRLFLNERMNKVKIIRLFSISFIRHIPVIRGLDQFLLSVMFFFGGINSGKPDVILTYSPPLPLGISAYLLGKLKKAPFIFNVQDIFPQSVIDLGLLKSEILIRISELMEKFIYKKAFYITVHSEGNRENIISKNINPEKVITIYNWVDTDLIKPVKTQDNNFREKNNLRDRFVVSFAGVMGFAQDLDIIIQCAKLLKSYKNILFLLIGDGIKKYGLMKKAKDMQLNNIKFLSTQPKEIYPSILYASDVCLVTLNKQVLTPVVPSKLLSIMASGRPVVASMNLKGDAPKVIKAAHCGYYVEADDAEGLSKAILKLYHNPTLRDEFGVNGRKYAVKHFSRKVCLGKYEKLFLRACESKRT